MMEAIKDTCEFCKEWLTRSKNDYGRCMLSMYKRSRIMSSGCGLTTYKDFGCKLFKLREEK